MSTPGSRYSGGFGSHGYDYHSYSPRYSSDTRNHGYNYSRYTPRWEDSSPRSSHPTQRERDDALRSLDSYYPRLDSLRRRSSSAPPRDPMLSTRGTSFTPRMSRDDVELAALRLREQDDVRTVRRRIVDEMATRRGLDEVNRYTGFNMLPFELKNKITDLILDNGRIDRDAPYKSRIGFPPRPKKNSFRGTEHIPAVWYRPRDFSPLQHTHY